jgi:hypothetical protein
MCILWGETELFNIIQTNFKLRRIGKLSLPLTVSSKWKAQHRSWVHWMRGVDFYEYYQALKPLCLTELYRHAMESVNDCAVNALRQCTLFSRLYRILFPVVNITWEVVSRNVPWVLIHNATRKNWRYLAGEAFCGGKLLAPAQHRDGFRHTALTRRRS